MVFIIVPQSEVKRGGIPDQRELKVRTGHILAICYSLGSAFGVTEEKNRRALYSPYNIETPLFVAQSILEIRKELTMR